MIEPSALPYALRATLAESGLAPLEVGVPVEAPQVWLVGFKPAPRNAAQSLRIGPALQAAFNSGPVRIAQAGAWISVEIPRPENERLGVYLGAMMPGQIGVTPFAGRVRVDLERVPHVLVAGQTGSGKSGALRAIAWGLAQDHSARLILVDSDNDTWAPFERAAALAHDIARTPGQADAALRGAELEMDWRLSEGIRGPGRLVVIVDEIQRLGPDGAAAVLEIATRGRKARVHIIAATQYPRADILDQRAKEQFAGRIVGRMESAIAGHWTGSAAAPALLGRGDMLLIINGHENRIQIAHAEDDDRVWGRVPKLDAGAALAPCPGQAGARTPRRDPETPLDARAWIASRATLVGALPGINSVARRFGVGNTKAERWLAECRERLESDGWTEAAAAAALAGHPASSQASQPSRLSPEAPGEAPTHKEPT